PTPSLSFARHENFPEWVSRKPSLAPRDRADTTSQPIRKLVSKLSRPAANRTDVFRLLLISGSLVFASRQKQPKNFPVPSTTILRFLEMVARRIDRPCPREYASAFAIGRGRRANPTSALRFGAKNGPLVHVDLFLPVPPPASAPRAVFSGACASREQSRPAPLPDGGTIEARNQSLRERFSSVLATAAPSISSGNS